MPHLKKIINLKCV